MKNECAHQNPLSSYIGDTFSRILYCDIMVNQLFVIGDIIMIMIEMPIKIRNFLKFHFLEGELSTSLFCWDLSFLLLSHDNF